MVGLGRIELPTSRLSGVRSSHLSYRPSRSRKPARGDDDSPALRRPRSPVGANGAEAPLTNSDACRCTEEVALVSGFLSELVLLRKEVIQPQVPLRLPCYDFTPITSHTLGACPPCGLAPATSGTTGFRGVTGGVYKARERIHRGVLIRDY